MIKMKVIRCGIKTKEDRKIQGGNKSNMQKDCVENMKLGYEGCYTNVNHDYNHYRSVNKKLRGTNDRAVSIITEDIYKQLKLELGNLGENIIISNLSYRELNIGSKLMIGNVEIEITENIMPCARLGNQDWAESLGGKLWWKKSELINRKGGRGWYCKVIKEGVINIGDEVQ